MQSTLQMTGQSSIYIYIATYSMQKLLYSWIVTSLHQLRFLVKNVDVTSQKWNVPRGIHLIVSHCGHRKIQPNNVASPTIPPYSVQ